jgi:ATP-dependent DNA ligase
MLCAFDVLSINGEDVRREPIEERKAELAKLLRRPRLTASLSMSSSPATVRSSIATLAGSAARVSSASGTVRPIAVAASHIGSRSRIPTRPR